MTLPLIPLGLMGRTAPPSFPILRSTNNYTGTALATSHTVDLPVGIEAGDLVILAYFARSTGDMTGLPTPPGWESLAFVDFSPGSFRTALVRIIYQVAPGPMSTVNVSTPGAVNHVKTNSFCFSLWSNIASTAFAVGESSGPNPPALTPSGWGQNPRTTWLSLMAIRASVVSVNGTSAGFTDTISSSGGGASFARIESSRREERAPSLDPGPWSLSGSEDWVAATIAVRGT